jgi:hypothetical protein
MTLIPLVLAIAALLMATRACQDEARMTARLDRACGETFASVLRGLHERRLIEARLAQLASRAAAVHEASRA